MRTKNARAIDPAESAWLTRVKQLPCSCCGAAGPSDAHHIVQGQHFTTIPLCKECHQGAGGIHGDKSRWRQFKATVYTCLNKTIRALAAGAADFSATPIRKTRTLPRDTGDVLPKIVPRPWG